MTKINLIRKIKSIESAKKFNDVVERKSKKLDSQIRKKHDEIEKLKTKISSIKNDIYKLEHPERDGKTEYAYSLTSEEVHLDFDKIDKVAKLDDITVYKINGEWFKISGKYRDPEKQDTNDIDWDLRKVTNDELYYTI